MKVLAVGGFAVVAGAVLYFFGGGQRPADVYDMPVAETYAKLMHAEFEPLGEGAKALDTTHRITGNGSDKVVWLRQGSMARFECEMALAPWADDPQQTKITMTCNGGGAGSGAAAGMLHNMVRNDMIERLDANLTGRPIDLTRAGSTASRWPGDGVDGSLGTAVGEAIKMDAEMHKMQQEIEQVSREAERNAPRVSDSPYRPSGAKFGDPGYQ